MGEQVDARLKWGCSSVGRAPALQAGGQGFESLHLHCVCSTHSRCEPRKHSFLGHGITCQCIWIYNRLGMQAFHTILNSNALASILYLENCILENTNIFITQKIQDIRDKNQEMFVNANETWTNIHNAIWMVKLVKLERAQGGCLGTKSRWKTW